jgi:hypothetical protein
MIAFVDRMKGSRIRLLVEGAVNRLLGRLEAVAHRSCYLGQDGYMGENSCGWKALEIRQGADNRR